MTLYAKDKSFSAGWMFGGAVVMTIANVFAGVLLGVLGVRSLEIFIGVSCAIYLVCGFLIGWRSEGQTIIEAGLAAMLATAVGVALQALRGRVELLPVTMAIASTPPFLCGLLGAFIGEKVQGDSVEVQD